MRRFAAIVILGLTAGGLMACGASGEGQLPQSSAQELLRELDQIEEQVQAQDCVSAQQNATDFQATVEALPSSVDAELHSALREGATALVSLSAPPDCNGEPVEEIPEEPPPPPVETEPEEKEKEKGKEKEDKEEDEREESGGPDGEGPPGQEPPDGEVELDDDSGGVTPPGVG